MEIALEMAFSTMTAQKPEQLMNLLLIPDLEWLQLHGKNGFERYDANRMDYLKKNGVTVYGAVVTGPVRELEKLRQNELFHDFELGRIEVWNW